MSTENEIDRLFEDLGEEAAENSGDWLSEIALDERQAERLEMNNVLQPTPIEVLGQKAHSILEALLKIDIELKPRGTTENICIGFGQEHGALELFPRMNAARRLEWFKKQRVTINLLNEMVREIGAETLEFFIENFTDPHSIQVGDLQKLDRLEQQFDAAAEAETMAVRCIDSLLKLHPPLQPNIHSTMMGMHRFPLRAIASGVLQPDHVHPCEYPDREAGRKPMLQAQTPEEFIEQQIDDFHKLHASFMTSIRQHLVPGKVGVILIGSVHFATPIRIGALQQYVGQGLIDRCKTASLESYLAQLSSTWTMIAGN